MKCISESVSDPEPVLAEASSTDTAVGSKIEEGDQSVDPLTMIKLEPVHTYFSSDNLVSVENLASIKQETEEIDHDIGDLDFDVQPHMMELEPVRSRFSPNNVTFNESLTNVKQETVEFDLKTEIEIEEDLFLKTEPSDLSEFLK